MDFYDRLWRTEVYLVAKYVGIPLLPSAQQEVIELRYFEGLTLSSIARITGKTENAIGILHHRALKRLKAFMVRINHEP